MVGMYAVTLAYDNVQSNQVWIQKDQQFRSYSRNTYLDHLRLRRDLDLEVANNLFLHNTLALQDA